MELPLLEGGMQMLGPRMGVHDGDCLACSQTLCDFFHGGSRGQLKVMYQLDN